MSELVNLNTQTMNNCSTGSGNEIDNGGEIYSTMHDSNDNGTELYVNDFGVNVTGDDTW